MVRVDPLHRPAPVLRVLLEFVLLRPGRLVISRNACVNRYSALLHFHSLHKVYHNVRVAKPRYPIKAKLGGLGNGWVALAMAGLQPHSSFERVGNALAFDMARFPSYGRVDVLLGRGNAWKALPTRNAALHNPMCKSVVGSRKCQP